MESTHAPEAAAPQPARRGKKPKPAIDRLLARCIRDETTGCLEWQGSRLPKGYGHIGIGSVIDGTRTKRATHRVAYEATYGPIPPGMLVCHRCDNPPCCNPDHLFLGTPADNMDDKVAKGRQPRGEDAGASKLTDTLVREIRARYAAGGISQSALAAEYGIHQMTVSDLVRRKTWAHVA